VCYGATHIQKDDVARNGSTRMVQSPLSCPVCGVQLVLGISVLTLLDLNELDVTLKCAKIFESVLSGDGRSSGGFDC